MEVFSSTVESEDYLMAALRAYPVIPRKIVPGRGCSKLAKGF